MQRYTDYAYRADVVPHGAGYLVGPIEGLCGELSPAVRVLEVGCGRGFYAGWFAAHGCQVVAIDDDGVALHLARRSYPSGRFEEATLEPGLLERLGEAPFDLVVCTQSIDRAEEPRRFAAACFEALRPGGRLICAAPYHGYLKNVARAVVGASDPRLDPLAEDARRVRLWSRRSLGRLLRDAGFENIQFRGAGRVPFLWETMVIAGDRPMETLAARSEAPPLVA